MGERESTAKLAPILLRIIDRLRSEISECNENNTFLSTLPNVTYPNTGEFLFEVAPDETWQFESGHFTGAGKNALHTTGLVTVTLHSFVQNDEVGKDLVFLTNQSRGVLRLIDKILDVLSDHELADKDGNKLLSEPLRPTSLSIPGKDKREKGWLTLSFAVEFDWVMEHGETFTPDPEP